MPGATAADWAAIFSHAEVRTIGEGLALVQAGEDDRALYLLTEGSVGVKLPRDEGHFKTIDAPSVLGELAFFDARPPAAGGGPARGVGPAAMAWRPRDRPTRENPGGDHA